MHWRVATIAILSFGPLWGCSPAPRAAAPKPAPAVAPAPAAPPAKMATMICRNSQTGKKVACGTPNAVMVGMKTD